MNASLLAFQGPPAPEEKPPTPPLQVSVDPMKDQIDHLRAINERLHAKIQQIELDAQAEILATHRLYAPAWEQRQITRAIDDLRSGKFVDFVPMALAIKQLDEAMNQPIIRRRIL